MCTNFLRELKEQGIIKVEWIATEENNADLFTKNLQGPLFERHTSVYVRDIDLTDSQREGVEERILSHKQPVNKKATKSESPITEYKSQKNIVEPVMGQGGKKVRFKDLEEEGLNRIQDQGDLGEIPEEIPEMVGKID